MQHLEIVLKIRKTYEISFGNPVGLRFWKWSPSKKCGLYKLYYVTGYLIGRQKLPDEATSPEALATQDRINEQFFMVLKENMNSSNPAWKVMGLKEVQERQQKRKDQQQKKEAKLKEKQSNEFTTE